MDIEYDNKLNKRIEPRLYPSQQLRPLYEVRPVSTKYTFFQTVEERPFTTVPTINYKPYSMDVFNPGRGQVDFYMREIDTESKLRNQFMALQKSNHAVYVPEFTSNLYEYPLTNKTEKYTSTTCTTTESKCNLAPHTFHNVTRMNLRN